MQITSTSFEAGGPIPERNAFCRIDAANHCAMSDNVTPHLAWTGVPDGCRSLVLICVDPDVPTRPDDVNQEGRTVPGDLPRTDFHHWVMVDLDPATTGLDEGAAGRGIVARGKQDPPGPAGSRQGKNDYTGWFEGDPDMGGTYLGYDGPCPPWNDELVHHYHFRLYATDFDRCPVEGVFTGTEVLAAIDGHVLGQAEIVGTFTLNPGLR